MFINLVLKSLMVTSFGVVRKRERPTTGNSGRGRMRVHCEHYLWHPK
jgi:hypothetical protein